ncbi:MAG: hypothetical protein J6B87_04060 [Clostridia bacterium]|nr:hypothetical protein [Clostridia bacterium]
MNNARKKVDELSKAIRAELGQDTDEIRNSESLLYAVPYNSLPVTSPKNENEEAIVLENIILAVKERIIDEYGTTARIFELYTEDGEKIGGTDEDGRMIYDKEIMDELIKEKIRIIRESGKEPAGLDSLNSVESVFDMIGRQLVVMNEEEKERLDSSKDRRLCLAELTDEHDKRDESDMTQEADQSEDYDLQNPEQENMAMEQMSQDLGIDVHKITKIDPHDGAFWENNPDIKTRDAYAALTTDGRLQIVGNNNGKFEPVDGFSDPSNESGRTTVIKNDEDNLHDNVRNTYGALYSTRNPNMRYTLEYGQYGEIKLVEQIRLGSGAIEQSDKYVSREVANSNTDFMEQNLEGNESSDNITVRTFRQYRGINRDSKVYGNSNGRGGTSEIGHTMKNDGHRDYTMQQFSADEDSRVVSAFGEIVDELNSRNISLDPDEEDTLVQKLRNYLKNNDKIVCKEEVIEYANEIQLNKQIEERKTQNQDVSDQDQGDDNERTLGGDAYERRMR